ncbi:hypothetical protein CC99x_009935 [Candidatus Berkiella cookevillensis]|uniref:Uncharacterized protein n=1 Tax=Candidatus Berkiella cookevillensis TaxID=437022 RepID=A0A0Q9YPS2_9GAMM|nr:hypothetical protein [Candidatus Berkiella cookevillensis]MCS5709224.1 hypothetical protein [Candidatus Berkiella cookevillensis]
MRLLNTHECNFISGANTSVTTDIYWEQFYYYSGITSGIVWGSAMPPLILTVNFIAFSVSTTANLVSELVSLTGTLIMGAGQGIASGVTAAKDYYYS